jgi:hypothetical protein
MALEQRMLSLRPSSKGALGAKSFPLRSNPRAPIAGRHFTSPWTAN